MKTKMRRLVLLVLVISTPAIYADTFKHKSTDEVFHGFRTHKSSRTKKEGTKTLVFNREEKKLTAISLNDYEITSDTNGRRDSAIIVPITESEIMLSQAVSETIAKAIIDASNTGPQVVILQIDNPGGRGEYMKIIADAITQTTQHEICPVVAYISGGPYGGAFSSAAVLALACDKIYISPTASVGAVGPMAGAGLTDEAYEGYLKTYSPDSLATYSIYVNSLAENNKRPSLLVQALMNKHLSILEVTEINGGRQFVKQDERQPTQTIVRTLCSGMPSPADAQTAVISPATVVGAVLQLSPSDAVDVGLTDQIADSFKEILITRNLENTQLVNAPGIDKILKKYAAARRNISEGLARIDQMEEYAAVLDEQLGEVEKMVRTGTQTREVNQGSPYSSSLYRRGRVRLPDGYGDYYYDPDNPYVSRTKQRSDYTNMPRSRSITVEEPTNINAIYNESIVLLRDLISEYRRVTNLGKRWPGCLPPELPLTTLQENMNSAETQLDRILRYQVQFQQQQQQQYYNGRDDSTYNRYERNRRRRTY